MFTRIKVSRLFINSTPARLSHLELVLSMLAVVLSMDGGPLLTLLGEETRKVLGLGWCLKCPEVIIVMTCTSYSWLHPTEVLRPRSTCYNPCHAGLEPGSSMAPWHFLRRLRRHAGELVVAAPLIFYRRMLGRPFHSLGKVRWLLLSKDDWQMEDLRSLLSHQEEQKQDHAVVNGLVAALRDTWRTTWMLWIWW